MGTLTAKTKPVYGGAVHMGAHRGGATWSITYKRAGIATTKPAEPASGYVVLDADELKELVRQLAVHDPEVLRDALDDALMARMADLVADKVLERIAE